MSVVVSVMRKRINSRFGDCNSPFVQTACHIDQSVMLLKVAVSISDIAITPATYSEVTATRPLPDKAQSVAVVSSTPLYNSIQIV